MATDEEKLILEVCKKYPNGVDDETLHKEVGHRLTIQERAAVINKLLHSSRIELFSSGNGLVYKIVNLDQAIKFRGLSAEDHIVYQAIEQAQNSGIWTRDLRYRTKLSTAVMNKSLKALENRHLVKTFRPVENKTRKMYILHTLEPAEHLTGGAWYTDTEKDTEFIEVLREACYKRISWSGSASLSEISSFIKERKLARVQLRDENVKSILDTLLFEGRIEVVEEEDDVQYRPASLSLPETGPFSTVPCGVCPVFTECHPEGQISPDKCIYFTKCHMMDFPAFPPHMNLPPPVPLEIPSLFLNADPFSSKEVDKEDERLTLALSKTTEVFQSSLSFNDLGLSQPLLQGIHSEMGFDRPSSIQARTLPLICKRPFSSLVAQAHNGSGKTCCFVSCILSRIDCDLHAPQALVVVPTRELAAQNENVIKRMGKFLKITTVASPSKDDERLHPHNKMVIVSTMGTLMSWRRQGQLPFKNLKVVVFDEADVMISMDQFGDHSLLLMMFIDKETKPNKSQILMFSATYNNSVRDYAHRLFATFKRNEVLRIFLNKEELTLDSIAQANVKCYGYREKIRILTDCILKNVQDGKVIIFVRTRSMAADLHDILIRSNWTVTSISGDMSFEDRDRVVKEFRESVTNILVATDVLARGFDVLDVRIVINFDVPKEYQTYEPAYETYLHRVGRSGRFRHPGVAFNFVDLRYGEGDLETMEKISKYFDREIPMVEPDDESKFLEFLKKAKILL